MKKIIATVGMLVLVGTLANPLFAHGPQVWGRGESGGPGPCWRQGSGHETLSRDQQNRLSKLDREFFNNTAELRSEIWKKSEELNILLNAPEPDAVKARALQEEISALRAKMAQHRLDYELESRRIAPNSRIARGYGRPMKGYGPHHWGAGKGPGACFK